MTLNEQLHEAVRCGLEPQIAGLVADGADINYMNAKGWTALGLAVAGGQMSMAKFLVALGARADVVSPNGQQVAKELAAA
jgi:ankyrin repeat protein